MDQVTKDHLRRQKQGAFGIRHLVKGRDEKKEAHDRLVQEVAELGKANREAAIDAANAQKVVHAQAEAETAIEAAVEAEKVLAAKVVDIKPRRGRPPKGA